MAISLGCMQDVCTAAIAQNSVGPELPEQHGNGHCHTARYCLE